MTTNRSMLETLFAEQIRTAKLPRPEREYVFHPDRRWRFDFAWLGHHCGRAHPGADIMCAVRQGNSIAVEIEGGTWVAGRHVRGQAFEDDCEKYAEALILGWSVLRVTSHMVEDGRAIALLRRLFDA